MAKKLLLNNASVMMLCLCLCTTVMAKSHRQISVLTSPDGKLVVTAVNNDGLTWAVEYQGIKILEPSAIDLSLNGRQVVKGKSKEVAREQVSNSFFTPFYKKAQVEDCYQTMTLRYATGIDVVFRAYNDGVAYRLVYTGKKEVTVDHETTAFCFADDYPSFVPYVNDNRGGERYCYSFESYYDEVPLSKMYADSLAITPFAVCLPQGVKAIVMDAGVENYPGMMLVKGEGNSLRAEYAPYPLEQEIGGFDRLNLVPTQRADYIAKLNGSRTLPWRAVVVTTKDTDILNCDMAQRLAPACRIKDTSWIHPGKVAWDWWNNTT